MAVALGLLTACAGQGRSGGDQGRPQIIAAFYPLQFVAQEVGGSAIEVESLTPSGVEPHDLELSAGQIRDLRDADLVVFLGGGFQPAVEDALEGLDTARQYDALAGRDLLQSEEGEGLADPHVWLDPSILGSIAKEMATRLSKLDPGEADRFSDNAARLQDSLRRLDQEYSAGLAHCRSREIVTSHEAFGYLATRYDLEQVSISGIDPEAEPTPGRLAEVASFVREHHVTTIFFEELAPPDLAETLARETGARTDVLSPLETPPEDGDYPSEMRVNLRRLETALACA
jgi:zinc transport system substrate-binding protein